jgi:hypothetical protein
MNVVVTQPSGLRSPSSTMPTRKTLLVAWAFHDADANAPAVEDVEVLNHSIIQLSMY